MYLAVFEIRVTVRDPKVRGQLVSQLVHANFSVKVSGHVLQVAAPGQALGKAFHTYTFIRNRVFTEKRYARRQLRPTEQPHLTEALSEVPSDY
jgi:hypothetical protein